MDRIWQQANFGIFTCFKVLCIVNMSVNASQSPSSYAPASAPSVKCEALVWPTSPGLPTPNLSSPSSLLAVQSNASITVKHRHTSSLTPQADPNCLILLLLPLLLKCSFPTIPDENRCLQMRPSARYRADTLQLKTQHTAAPTVIK